MKSESRKNPYSRLLLLIPALLIVTIAGLLIILVLSSPGSSAPTPHDSPGDKITETPTEGPALASRTETPPAAEIWTASAPAVPAGGAPIAAGNLDRLAELSHLGDGWPSAAAFSPDGKVLAIGSSLGVNLYSAENGSLVDLLPSDSPVLSVLYSPDGAFLAAGQSDGQILLFDSDTGAVRRKFSAHSRPVHGLAFSRPEKPGGPARMLASGDEEGTVVVWSLVNGQAQYQFSNPLFGYWGYGVRSLAFSPRNEILATGGDQGYVALWDLARGEELPHLQSQHGLVFSIAFSPDGNTLASACGDGSVQLWNFASGAPVLRLTGQEYGAWSVAYSPDGATIATGAGDGTLRVWDARTGALRGQAVVSYAQVDSLAFSADGSRLAAVSLGETARVLNAANLSQDYTERLSFGALRAAGFSPDSTRIILAGENGSLYLWEPGSETVRGVSYLRPGNNAGIAVAFSPDGGTLAVADGSRNSLSLMDPSTFTVRATQPVRGGRTAAYGPDGAYLAAGGTELYLWEASGGTSRKLGMTSAITSLAFPRAEDNGAAYLAAGADNGSINLWGLPSADEPHELFTGEGNPIWALAADRYFLAAGDSRGVMQVWDLRNETLLWSKPAGSTEAVFSLAVSPDGRILASAGRDSVVRFWDLTNGDLLGSLPGENGWVFVVAFSPDGRWLLTAGKDGSAKIWGVTE
jgi:WD40 repeat protein